MSFALPSLRRLGKSTRSLFIVLSFAAISSLTLPAQDFTLVYAFTGTDGATPNASVIRDNSGNLYGTTEFGGISPACNGGGCGTVFKVSLSGAETVLYAFTGGSDGSFPSTGSLLADSEGNLFGTTEAGGAGISGTIFKINASGVVTILHSFSTTADDGAVPIAGLARDPHGNIYGTTKVGGSSLACNGIGCGTVYRVDPAGNTTIIYSFSGVPNGAFPESDVVFDKSGNIYGTTLEGGKHNLGTAYKIDSTGKESILHSFAGFSGRDGERPGQLVVDPSGNIFGTTYYGGSFQYGTIFKVSGDGQVATVFSFKNDNSSGAFPAGKLAVDASGNLYGTTTSGGAGSGGTVYKFDRSGVLTLLHYFKYTDGTNPTGGISIDADGNLYGTSSGIGTVCQPPNCGTVFTITP